MATYTANRIGSNVPITAIEQIVLLLANHYRTARLCEHILVET